MWLAEKFRIRHSGKNEDFTVYADAVILSVLPGSKLQLHVFPAEGRNFVTEVFTHSPLSSYLSVGQRLRVKYFPGQYNDAEIIEHPG